MKSIKQYNIINIKIFQKLTDELYFKTEYFWKIFRSKLGQIDVKKKKKKKLLIQKCLIGYQIFEMILHSNFF